MKLNEIDRLVAEKVMGWRPVWGVWLGLDGLSTGYGFDDGARYFCPTTDIVAAWEVLEKLGSDIILYRNSEGGWGISENWRDFEDGIYLAYEPSATLAISLAALKAKGIEVPV